MAGQKKKFSPMIYYVIWTDDHDYVFANKSTGPTQSVRHHFNRARNPQRADFNEPLAKWLRSKPVDQFHVHYCVELPDFVSRRAHLCELPPDFTPPQIVPFENLYYQLAKENHIPLERQKKSFSYKPVWRPDIEEEQEQDGEV